MFQKPSHPNLNKLSTIKSSFYGFFLLPDFLCSLQLFMSLSVFFQGYLLQGRVHRLPHSFCTSNSSTTMPMNPATRLNNKIVPKKALQSRLRLTENGVETPIHPFCKPESQIQANRYRDGRWLSRVVPSIQTRTCNEQTEWNWYQSLLLCLSIRRSQAQCHCTKGDSRFYQR